MSEKQKMPQVLIVEDDTAVQRQMRWSFKQYELLFAEERDTALAEIRRHEPLVMLLDLGLPPDAEGVSEGMQTLSEALRVNPNTKVIVVTGNGDAENALRAVGMGAYDFYQKPVDTEVLGLIIERAVHIGRLEAQNRRLRSQVDQPLSGLVSASPQMSRVVRQIEKIAPTNASTLLLGDTGSGKELLARALHSLSPRNGHRFAAINCGAIPENLLESELFGHEKGAFTGADRQQIGKIELADKGTLFLDEIGDMDPSLQVKLLRFLEERVVERVGGRREIQVDVRVICATHRNLQSMIADGRFREDLYYRIAEITVAIPPLKERDGDAVLLANYFLEKAAEDNARRVRGFSADALRALEAYDWPGNVRELEHRVNRAVIMAEADTISPEELALERVQDNEPSMPLNLRTVRDDAERSALEKALNYAAGNMSMAARVLGVSRPALYDLLKKHDLQARA